MGPIGCSETSVRNYHSRLHTIPKHRRSQILKIKCQFESTQSLRQYGYNARTGDPLFSCSTSPAVNCTYSYPTTSAQSLPQPRPSTHRGVKSFYFPCWWNSVTFATSYQVTNIATSHRVTNIATSRTSYFWQTRVWFTLGNRWQSFCFRSRLFTWCSQFLYLLKSFSVK